MIRDYLPKSNDVQEAIRYRTTSYTDVKRFFQKKGIIHIGNSKSDLAKAVSGILLSHQDYLCLRKFAQGVSSDTQISGFTLRSESIPLTLEMLKDDLLALRERINTKKDEKLNANGTVSRNLHMPIIEDNSLKAKFKYERVIPGRIELIQRVETLVNFTIEKLDNRHWRLICFPQANKDIQVLEKLFSQSPNKLYKPYKISLDEFTQIERIRFFDDILEHYQLPSGGSWKLNGVVGITVRKPNRIEEDELEQDSVWLESPLLEDTQDIDYVHNSLSDEDASIETLPSRDDLTSINQAILEGKHLRNNSFVIDCENKGFYFTSMTLELENVSTSEFIKIIIRFKLSPKLFEVVLADTRTKTSLSTEQSTFTSSRQQEILKEFWDTSHSIWENIRKTSSMSIPQQLTLGDIGMISA